MCSPLFKTTQENVTVNTNAGLICGCNNQPERKIFGSILRQNLDLALIRQTVLLAAFLNKTQLLPLKLHILSEQCSAL